MSSAVVHQRHPGNVEHPKTVLRSPQLGKAPVDVECCGVGLGPTELPVVKGDAGAEPDHEGHGAVQGRTVVDLRLRQTPSASTVEERTS
ncbi:hypothetical protein JZM24_00570 [Candidatus Sodalis endolongispinus]|uniref:Uncharacterized protein n=1 Tax=Candidatus Sodalis endolongispinus TaxID=2812662 RepID=A0ABS5Y7S7_9GAMM|nr:hypothetical protein [Candidatus Sodalis endolongispinus]MBT9431038.1 hypothetical protein [Candidatus Sodalis endolongispinus]